jgi:hypothetical protein
MDSCSAANIAASFEHLVGARDGEAERLGTLQVDLQLNFRGLLDWQVGELGALEHRRRPSDNHP